MKAAAIGLLVALLVTTALPVSAQAQMFVNGDKEGVQVGREVISPVASTALTVPATAEWAMISIRAAGIHINYDATAATTSSLYVAPGLYRTPYVARSSPNNILSSVRLINSSDGASTVYVVYFKRP